MSMEIKEASYEEASELLAKGWKLFSVQTVSKTVYVLVKESVLQPQPQVQEQAQPTQEKPVEESVDIYEVVGGQESGKRIGEMVQVKQSYDSLPWTDYPKGGGQWVHASPDRYQDPLLKSLVQDLVQRLESSGEVSDDRHVYSFSSKEKRFIKRVPKSG
ncbi:MAG: hypothetical protein QXY99_07025 [Thermoproteota archaeon]